MKKIITIATLTALALALMMTGALAADTDVPEHEHYATCQTPGVCAVCGLEDAALEGQHVYDKKQYYTTDYMHKLVCDLCGAKSDTYEFHKSSGSYLSNTTEHWFICSVCEAAFDRGVHFAVCTDPGICYHCGRVEASLEGQHSMHYRIQEDYHQYACIYCDEVTGEKESHVNIKYWNLGANGHEITCDMCTGGTYFSHRYDDANPGVCIDCGFGSSADSGDTHTHTYNLKKYGNDGANHWLICDTCDEPSTEVTAHSGDVQYSDTEHWYQCSACNQKYGAGAHTYEQGKYATNEHFHDPICDVCQYINYKNTGSHTSTGAWLHNETEHYRTCSVCGVNYDNETHDVRCTMPGVCYTCGAETSLEAQHNMVYVTYNSINHRYECINCFAAASEIESCTFSNYISINVQQHQAKCDVCGMSASLNHQYDMNNPTFCLDCGFEKPAADDSHEHSYFEDGYGPFNMNENNHWRVCEICALPDSGSITSHEWRISSSGTTATCTQSGNVVYYCRCGLMKTENGTLDHDWKETDRSAPTCTEAGSVTKVCRRCDETETEEIPALNHDWQEAHNIASTCVSKGYIMQVCMNCSETTLEEIDALGHDWYEAERKEPTATEKGYIIMACHNCDETTTEEIPTGADHDWYESERKEPTCTEKGYVITACHHCDETTTQEIPAQGHNWYEAERVEATDTAAGYILFACYNCDETSTEEIPALAHEWYEAERLEATCSEAGYILIACKHCDKTQTQELPKLDHQWGKPEIISATCTEEGSEKMTCTVCGVFTRIRIAPLGHSFPEGSPVCSVCGYNNASAVSPDGTEQTKTMEEIVAAFQAENPQAQIMHVSLNLGDLPLQLSGTIQITIPLEGTGWESFRLVQLHEDETITDVPYEIIDGKLVFEIDILGYFALIPA